MGSNFKPAKKAQKVKGTHTTTSKQRKQSVFVSSALNAYQAFDINSESLAGEIKNHRQGSALNIERCLAGGLSCNMFGITNRKIQGM